MRLSCVPATRIWPVLARGAPRSNYTVIPQVLAHLLIRPKVQFQLGEDGPGAVTHRRSQLHNSFRESLVLKRPGSAEPIQDRSIAGAQLVTIGDFSPVTAHAAGHNPLFQFFQCSDEFHRLSYKKRVEVAAPASQKISRRNRAGFRPLWPGSSRGPAAWRPARLRRGRRRRTAFRCGPLREDRAGPSDWRAGGPHA